MIMIQKYQYQKLQKDTKDNVETDKYKLFCIDLKSYGYPHTYHPDVYMNNKYKLLCHTNYKENKNNKANTIIIFTQERM